MSSYDLFIRRPIMTLMLTLALIVFGVLGYQRLGVDQFPKMDFPVVTVSAHLEGASPEVIEQDVTDVLEEHLNTIAGVRELSSKSYQGASVIRVEFVLGRDIDNRGAGRPRQGGARALPAARGRRAAGRRQGRLRQRAGALGPGELGPPAGRGERVRPPLHEAPARDDPGRGVGGALRRARARHPHLAGRRRPCARADSPRRTSWRRCGASTSSSRAARCRATASSTRSRPMPSSARWRSCPG